MDIPLPNDPLGKIGDSSIIEDLNLLSEKVGTREAILAIYCRQDVSFLLQLLAKYTREDNYLRYTVIEALGIIGNPTATPDLIAIAEKECESPYIGRVRDEIILAFARLRDPRAIPILLKVLESNRLHYNRYETNVIDALGEIGDEQAVPSLIRIANDKNTDRYTRYEAIEALGKIGGLEARDALVQILQTEADESAVKALGEIGDPQTIGVIISVLKRQDLSYSRRISAAEALGKIGNPEAVPYLIVALTDHYPEVSWKSAVALGQIFSKQPDPEKVKADALPALLDVIEKADENFNWGALQFLGPIGNGSERAVTVLHKLVGKKYWQGWWAVDILSEIGGLESIPVLMRANKLEAVRSILQRWHSNSIKSDEIERQKNQKIIRSMALRIRRRLAVNKFEALFAKIVLKRRKNPSWHYERWHYMSTDDTKLVTTLAEIMEDLAPIFDPMKHQTKSKLQKDLISIGWIAFAVANLIALAIIIYRVQSDQIVGIAAGIILLFLDYVIARFLRKQ
jgi:HEAT repeat protein